MDKLEDSVPRWEDPFNFDIDTQDNIESSWEVNDEQRADSAIQENEKRLNRNS